MLVRSHPGSLGGLVQGNAVEDWPSGADAGDPLSVIGDTYGPHPQLYSRFPFILQAYVPNSGFGTMDCVLLLLFSRINIIKLKT